MSFLLDTNVAIHIRDKDLALMANVEALGGPLMLSIVTRIELEGGVHRDPTRAPNRKARLDEMFSALPVVAFDSASADAYRTIVERAGYSRRKTLDRMIAAQAIAHRATLVTMSKSDFADIPDLKLLSW